MELATLSPNSLHQLAITAALNANWDEALKLNQQIMKLDPENVDALNRTARAYFELGNLSLSKKYYTLALKYDPYNPIAQKNLKIIQSCKNLPPKKIDLTQTENHSTNGSDSNNMRTLSSLFLQEPGKTKMVSLLKVAEPQKLSMSYPGMSVEMIIKNRKITILDRNNIYLGILPDDLSHRLLRLIKGGNKYHAFVKSVKANGLTILIRESFRSKRFKNQPSFPELQGNVSNTTILSALTVDSSSDDSSESDSEETI